jgi:hypothetical protein
MRLCWVIIDQVEGLWRGGERNKIIYVPLKFHLLWGGQIISFWDPRLHPRHHLHRRHRHRQHLRVGVRNLTNLSILRFR